MQIDPGCSKGYYYLLYLNKIFKGIDMWYMYVVLGLLVSSVCGYDDVFDDIPSQFDGWNVFLGVTTQSQLDVAEYDVYKFSGPTVFRGWVEVLYQNEKDLWVSGVVSHLGFSYYDKQVFENDGSNKIGLKFPLDFGVAYRKGFLFNPSTMLAANIGLGVVNVSYNESSNDTDANYYYLDAGVSMVLGVLTTWGAEIGVGLRASNDESCYLSGSKKYSPPRFDWGSKLGMVYHFE